MKKFSIPLILGVLFLAAPGVAQADPVFQFATLSGDQETPPNSSTATGSAIFVINDDQSAIYVYFQFDGLDQPATAGHIHFGDPAVSGPVILPFQNVPRDTSGLMEFTLTADDFHPAPNLPTFADAINAMLNGGCYINIHNSTFPGGEIRGQIY